MLTKQKNNKIVDSNYRNTIEKCSVHISYFNVTNAAIFSIQLILIITVFVIRNGSNLLIFSIQLIMIIREAFKKKKLPRMRHLPIWEGGG